MTDINYAVSPRTDSPDWRFDYNSAQWAKFPVTGGSFPGGTTTGVRVARTSEVGSSRLYFRHLDPNDDPSVAGRQFTVAADVVSNFTGTVNVHVGYRKSDGSHSFFNSNTYFVAGVSQRIIKTSGLLPANAVAVGLYVYSPTTGHVWASGDNLVITNVMVNEGTSALPFFDGSTPDALTDYGWTGTAGLSTSTATVGGVVDRTNLCPNPKGSVSASGYTALTATTMTAESGPFVRGTASSAGTNRGYRTPLSAVTINTPGSLYSGRLQVRCSAVGATVNYRPDRWSNSAQVSTGVGGSVVATGDWQDVTFTDDLTTGIGASVTSLRVSVFCPNSIPSGTTIDVRYVLVENTSSPGDYFDGDTPDIATGWRYDWFGTTNRSRSFRSWFVVGDTNVTLVPLPGIGAIRVRVEPGTTGEYVKTVYRTDVNGTAQVRTLAGYLPGAPNQPVNIIDQEAALEGGVSYEVTTSAGVFAASAVMGTSQPWLTVVIDPSQAVTVPMVSNYSAGRAAQTTVHQIIGRSDPLVTLGPLSTREGTLEFWCPDHATARSIERLYARRMVMLLRTSLHDGLDVYHVPRSTDVAPLNIEGGETRWAVRVTYVEVRRPTGNVLGTLGWDYDSVLAASAAYTAVTLAFEDYDALEIGPLT